MRAHVQPQCVHGCLQSTGAVHVAPRVLRRLCAVACVRDAAVLRPIDFPAAADTWPYALLAPKNDATALPWRISQVDWLISFTSPASRVTAYGASTGELLKAVAGVAMRMASATGSKQRRVRGSALIWTSVHKSRLISQIR